MLGFRIDLKGKLISVSTNDNNQNEELISVLQSLGYKNNDIKRVIKDVNSNISIEEQIKEALKLMLK